MSSSEPSVFNLAICCLVVPAYEVKFPPINIFPSDWIEIALTRGKLPPTPKDESNVLSSEPSVFNLATYCLVVDAYVVNSPPMMIFPSDWVEIALTKPFAPEDESNDVSSEPSVFNLAIYCLVVEAYEVKFPPINIFPSGWIEIARTELFAPEDESNDVSSEPSVFNLATYCLVVDAYVVK